MRVFGVFCKLWAGGLLTALVPMRLAAHRLGARNREFLHFTTDDRLEAAAGFACFRGQSGYVEGSCLCFVTVLSQRELCFLFFFLKKKMALLLQSMPLTPAVRRQSMSVPLRLNISSSKVSSRTCSPLSTLCSPSPLTPSCKQSMVLCRGECGILNIASPPSPQEKKNLHKKRQ